MNKQTKWGIVAIVVLIGGIMIFSFQKKERTLEEQMRHEQEWIVKFLYQNYSLTDNQKINVVEFVELQKNDITGSWRITAKVNRKYYISVKTDTLSEESDIRSANYSPTEFIKKNDTAHDENISDIEIIYFTER